MAEHRCSMNLSARGQVFADPSNQAPMLDIVCNLWHPVSNPGGFLSLGVAENTLMHQELIEYMNKSIQLNSHVLTYGDGFSGSHHLREVVATFITRHFSPIKPVIKQHVSMTSGVGPAVEHCAFSLCDPGDGILLGRPYYGSFPIDVSSRAKAKILGVSFGDVDPFSIKALACYEKAVQDACNNEIPVKALILCSPHNPLGRCYPVHVLQAYMRFCQKYNIRLISDEIYALSVWDNPDAPNAPGFTSVLSIDITDLIDPSLVHVLWGMSKDFCSNGIRLGCIISQNNDLFLRSLGTTSYFSCPSGLTDRATAAILSDTVFVKTFVSTNKARIAANYVLIAQFLQENSIPYQKASNAGFFIWVDLLAPLRERIGTDKLWVLEAKMQETLLGHKVFLASGKAFGSDVPGWFCIVFAHEKGYLKCGLERIVQAVDAFKSEL